MDHLADQINELRASQQRIENALLGDRQMNVEGLADKVGRHDRYIKNSQKRKWTFLGLTLGASSTVPQLVNYLKTLFL